MWALAQRQALTKAFTATPALYIARMQAALDEARPLPWISGSRVWRTVLRAWAQPQALTKAFTTIPALYVARMQAALDEACLRPPFHWMLSLGMLGVDPWGSRTPQRAFFIAVGFWLQIMRSSDI